MNTQPTTDNPTIDNRIFLNGKQLAEVLGVSAPSLSEAVKKGYNCAGYPVVEWAVETSSGRIKGYEVPDFLVSEELEKTEKRPNPELQLPNLANLANNQPNKGQKTTNNAQPAINNNYSLLPEGEDYFKPVGTVALSSVIKKALDKDTPQSRAVIATLLSILGAITGHAVTDTAGGAGVGAGAGLGIAFLAYRYFNPNKEGNNQLAFPLGGSNNIPTTSAKLVKSDFLTN